MFHYFKSKTAIRKKSYKKGFNKARKKRDDYWKGKIKEIKAEAEELLNEKSEEIKWRDKEIKKIKNTLDDLKDMIGKIRFRFIQIGQSKQSEFLEKAKENQETQRIVDEFESLYREANRKIKPVEKKIDNYNMHKIKRIV